MAKISRNLIEYYGISTYTYHAENFKQFNVDYMFNIPIEKPDMEQIVKVWIEPVIVCNKIVKTPKGTSLEGITMTGHKVLVCGDISIKIEFISCDTSHSVHSASSKFPFCSYIVLPEEFNANSVLSTSVLVEDVFSEKIDSRCIYNNITMMIIADIC